MDTSGASIDTAQTYVVCNPQNIMARGNQYKMVNNVVCRLHHCNDTRVYDLERVGWVYVATVSMYY